MANWNPWHGCKKISTGCENCYVYRSDAKYGKDSTVITKTNNFDLPIKQNKKGEYKLNSSETIYTCFTSDFFIDAADNWRHKAWEMMKIRNDLNFLFITKRIHRFFECIPDDWGDGYENVTICCTVENQDRVNFRLPIFINLPIKHKIIIAEPLLESIKIDRYLSHNIELVVAGGESGYNSRVCNFDWIKNLREQCVNHSVPFHFKQTGAKFIKDGKLYKIERKSQHLQAKKANIDYSC